jgi:hypothetical protein
VHTAAARSCADGRGTRGRGDGSPAREGVRVHDPLRQHRRPGADARQVHDGRHPPSRDDGRPAAIALLGHHGRRGARARRVLRCSRRPAQKGQSVPPSIIAHSGACPPLAQPSSAERRAAAQIQRRRKDLRVVVSSATLDAEAFRSFFQGRAPPCRGRRRRCTASASCRLSAGTHQGTSRTPTRRLGRWGA